jgi:hypothetical protein
MLKLTTLLALFAFAPVVNAAPPSAESIDALLAATKAERNVDTMLANLDPIMRQSMTTVTKGQQLSAEQLRELDAARVRTIQAIREEMAWDKMHPFYVQIYQETFTQEEIDGLIAFYKSPAGVAFVDKMPLVMQKSMSIMQSRMAPMMERMRAAARHAVDESKAATPAK